MNYYYYYDLLSNALYNVIQIKYWIAPFSMLDRTEELRENCLEEGREESLLTNIRRHINAGEFHQVHHC